MKGSVTIAAAVLVAACTGSKSERSASSGADRGSGDGIVTGGNGTPGGAGSGIGEDTPKGGVGIEVLLDGDLEISAGAIGKDIVRKVVKDHVGKLQYCYEKTLLANPGIEGTVTARFTIGTDGSVDDVKATGVHPEVESCVAEAVKAFRFPPSEAKVEVSYPFTFKPA